MQPNQPSQPFPPTPDPNQNNTPPPQDIPQYDPWTVIPQSQQQPSVAPSQPVAPQPFADDPYQAPIQPTAPAFQRQTPANPYQPVPQPQATQPVPQSMPSADRQWSQSPVMQNDAPVLAPMPAPKSQFELEYEAALNAPVKKDSPLKVIGLIVAGLLLVGGGAAALIWQQLANDPQARLYRALENHMTTNYIQQNYDMKMTAPTQAAAKIQAISDFSDPAKPKSHIVYQMKTSDDNSEYEQDGEIVIIEQGSYYAKLTKLPAMFDTSQEGMITTNKWYQTETDDFLAGMLLDSAGSRYAINTTTGQVLIGDYDEKDRSELMAFIKERNVYPIIGSESVNLSGQKTTHYTIDLNGKLIKELNEKAIKALDITDKEVAANLDQGDMKLELWISNQTDRIIQAKVEKLADEEGAKSGATAGTNTITVSYPTDVSKIKKPESIQPLPWER